MQGMFYGVIEEFLPPILNRQGDMRLARALTLARIPFALKFFIAPFVDVYATGIIGHSGWLIGTASIILPILNHLWQTIDVNVAQSTISGANTIYPLVVIACATAVSDVVVDVFALPLPVRALLQILGMLLGRLIPATISFLLSWDVNCVSCPFFMMLIVGALQIAGLFIWRFWFFEEEHGNSSSSSSPSSVWGVLSQTRDFFFYRKNMFWWLLHQLIPPMAYFHLISILPSRMQNYRGFDLGDVAQWDFFMFVPVVTLVIWANFRLQGDLRQFAKLYFLQACFSLALVSLYTWIPYTSGTKASYAAEASYGVAMRIQDTLFYMFELGEFNFYGQVAELRPAIAATIVAFQASMFNLAEFLHPNFAIWIVDATSSCGKDYCLLDSYPLVGAILTCCGVAIFIFLWPPLQSYSNIEDEGWKESNTIHPRNVVLFFALGILTLVALASGMKAAGGSV
jgi:hypothetical protein